MPSSLNGTGVTFNDGTQLNSRNEAGGNYIMRTFTSPTTWTKPAGLKAVKVTVVGGGGGGGGARNSSPSAPTSNAGQGGAGGVAIRFIPAPSIPGPVTVTGGAGAASAPGQPLVGPNVSSGVTPGNAGGTSSFGGFVSATGGAGATSQFFPPTNRSIGFPGAGGAGSGGDLNMAGSKTLTLGRNNPASFNMFSSPNQPAVSGFGNGQAGQAFGGGGTGATANNPTTRDGGAGANGVVIVEEFF